MSTIPVNSTVTLNDYIKALSTTDSDTSAYIPVSNNSTLKRMQINKITQSLSVASSSANGMMSSSDKTKLNNYPNSTMSSMAYPRFVGVLANGTVTTLGHAGQADLVANSQHGGLMTSSMYNTLMNSTRTVSTANAGLAPRGPQDATSATKYLRGDGTWVTPPGTTYGDVSVSGAGLAPDIPDTQTTYDHPRFLAATAMSSQAAWYHSDVQAFSASTVHGGFVPRVNRISTATDGSTSVNESDWIYTHRNGQNLAQWRSLAYLGLTTANAVAHTSYNSDSGDWSNGSAGYMSGLDALIVRNGASTNHRGTVPIISTSTERQWYQIAGNVTSATFKAGHLILATTEQHGLMSTADRTLLNDCVAYYRKGSHDCTKASSTYDTGEALIPVIRDGGTEDTSLNSIHVYLMSGDVSTKSITDGSTTAGPVNAYCNFHIKENLSANNALGGWGLVYDTNHITKFYLLYHITASSSATKFQIIKENENSAIWHGFDIHTRTISSINRLQFLKDATYEGNAVGTRYIDFFYYGTNPFDNARVRNGLFTMKYL